MEGFKWRQCTGPEKVKRVPRPLDFEELPKGANLHEFQGFALYLLHIVEKLQCFRIAGGKLLFKVSLVAKVPAVEHEWVDIAPDVRQIRDKPDLAIEIRGRWNGDLAMYLRAASFT